MKTLSALILVIGLQVSQQARITKPKRGSFLEDYPTYSGNLDLAQTGWRVNTGDFNLNVDLPPVQRIPASNYKPSYRLELAPTLSLSTNSLDKPIMEGQEYIPPQSQGTAIIPPLPPPAIPVNAAAANVPAPQGATFLGSGSIGVVSLGNGAYALGSGGLGYSDNRRRPRPTALVPVYPPIPATPDLIPAAVPTAQPVAVAPPNFAYGQQQPQFDQNGYEYLPPNRVGFGSPIPPRPLKVRQQFATPTALQLTPEQQQQQLQQQLQQQQLQQPQLQGGFEPQQIGGNFQFADQFQQYGLDGFRALS